jgi:hypothetical protein
MDKPKPTHMRSTAALPLDVRRQKSNLFYQRQMQKGRLLLQTALC